MMVRLYKSATTRRAWPLPEAFLIPPALLVVADFIMIKIYYLSGNDHARLFLRYTIHHHPALGWDRKI